jgi:drug/metabolite transporter (DMT)-like permease
VLFTTIVFWYAVTNTVLFPVWSIFYNWMFFLDYNAKLTGLILTISFCFWLMKAIITYAMKFIPGSLAGVLIYIAVPIAYILDVAFFGTKVGVLELCGVAIIVLTNMLIGIIDYCNYCPAKTKVEKQEN